MSAANERDDMGEHIGELAELYALGVLEPHERVAVETHVASCAACARALGESEATVAALDDVFVPQFAPPERLAARIMASAQTVVPFTPHDAAATPAARPPRRLPSFLATAAALLLAAGLGGGVLLERNGDMRQAARDSAILATIASSHFQHVSFTSRDSAAPVSKALYARDGAWFYVVVDSATCACHVVARSAAGERDLGEPDARGSTATLFVRDFPRPTSLELVGASGRVIANATLAYPSQ